jgi:predicted membrane channel-forming protein YqfA (hemolysin III family)
MWLIYWLITTTMVSVVWLKTDSWAWAFVTVLAVCTVGVLVTIIAKSANRALIEQLTELVSRDKPTGD